MNVTRHVVADLWPLCAAGQASDETRMLVDEFLVSDPEFARVLKASVRVPDSGGSATPDPEAAALSHTRDLGRGASRLRGLRVLALVLTVLAVSRVMMAIPWAEELSRLLRGGVAAALAWTAYALLLRRSRRRALRTGP